MEVHHSQYRIDGHMRTYHGLSTRDYFKKYIKLSDPGEGEDEENRSELNLPVSGNHPFSVQLAVSDSIKENNEEKNTNELHNIWADTSRFSCPICGMKSLAFIPLKLHLKEAHGQSGDELERMVKPDPDAKFHHCKMCDADVVHTQQHLDFHLNNVHSCTVKDYYEKYIVPGSKDVKSDVKEDDQTRSGETTPSECPNGHEQHSSGPSLETGASICEDTLSFAC